MSYGPISATSIPTKLRPVTNPSTITMRSDLQQKCGCFRTEDYRYDIEFTNLSELTLQLTSRDFYKPRLWHSLCRRFINRLLRKTKRVFKLMLWKTSQILNRSTCGMSSVSVIFKHTQRGESIFGTTLSLPAELTKFHCLVSTRLPSRRNGFLNCD